MASTLFFDSVIEEILLFEGNLAVQFRVPESGIAAFGQYYLASTADDLLPRAVFHRTIEKNLLSSVPGVPRYWKCGTRLRVRGPLGKKHALPGSVPHLVCIAGRDPGYCLQPVLEGYLQKGSPVVLCTDQAWMDLPVSVEIQPLALLPDLIPWADMIVLDISALQVNQFQAWLKGVSRATPAYALVHTHMPCGGGDCGLCGIRTFQGIRRACEEGPLFNWHDLDGAA